MGVDVEPWLTFIVSYGCVYCLCRLGWRWPKHYTPLELSVPPFWGENILGNSVGLCLTMVK